MRQSRCLLTAIRPKTQAMLQQRAWLALFILTQIDH
jgi:hypothetical protein